MSARDFTTGQIDTQTTNEHAPTTAAQSAASRRSFNIHKKAMTRRKLLKGVAVASALSVLSGVGRAQEAGEFDPSPTGQYIVGTKSQAGVMAASTRARSVDRVLDLGSSGQIVIGEFSQQDLKALNQRSDVHYIEPDHLGEYTESVAEQSEPSSRFGEINQVGEVNQFAAEFVPWGVKRIHAPRAHRNGFRGKGAHIAIIDSGIDYRHPDLNSNLGVGRGFAGEHPYLDSVGHGTGVAGCAAAARNGGGVFGAAPQAMLHSAKVDSGGAPSLAATIAAVVWTADNKFNIANMSLKLGASQALADACKYAYNRGVFLVAAAGNDSKPGDPAPVSYPAALSTVVAVSATNNRDRLASFSNRGRQTELAAPGVTLWTTSHLNNGEYFTQVSGTSFASPYVAGAAALLMGKGRSNTATRRRLKRTAEDIGLPPAKQGHGLVDALAAVK